MTAPLSLFLTRFSAPPVALLAGEPGPASPLEPQVTLSLADLDARLEAVRQAAILDAERRHSTEMAAAAATHAEAMARALAVGRAEWAGAEGARLAVLIETAIAEIRASLAARVASVLRPWIAQAAIERAKQGLVAALDRLLADPGKPYLRVSGPGDLVAALRDSRPDAAVDWNADDKADVTILAEATQIETCLAPTFAALLTEIRHV